MTTPVKPQVDNYDGPAGTGSAKTTVTKSSRTVDSGIEHPYAKDATSNVPARDGTKTTVEHRVQSNANGSASDMTGKIERPYAEDKDSSASNTYVQTAKDTATDVKNAAVDKAGAVKDQATDNLKAADDKHHYA